MGTLSWVGAIDMLHRFIPPSVSCGDEGLTRGWVSFNVFLSFPFCSQLLSSQIVPLHDPAWSLESFLSSGNWFLVSKSRTVGFLPRYPKSAYSKSPSSNWSCSSWAHSLVSFSSPPLHTYLLVLLLPSSSPSQYLFSLSCALWDNTDSIPACLPPIPTLLHISFKEPWVWSTTPPDPIEPSQVYKGEN